MFFKKVSTISLNIWIKSIENVCLNLNLIIKSPSKIRNRRWSKFEGFEAAPSQHPKDALAAREEFERSRCCHGN